jgi:hypothetical protein
MEPEGYGIGRLYLLKKFFDFFSRIYSLTGPVGGGAKG